jgi:hypothetical protein
MAMSWRHFFQKILGYEPNEKYGQGGLTQNPQNPQKVMPEEGFAHFADFAPGIHPQSTEGVQWIDPMGLSPLITAPIQLGFELADQEAVIENSFEEGTEVLWVLPNRDTVDFEPITCPRCKKEAKGLPHPEESGMYHYYCPHCESYGARFKDHKE